MFAGQYIESVILDKPIAKESYLSDIPVIRLARVELVTVSLAAFIRAPLHSFLPGASLAANIPLRRTENAAAETSLNLKEPVL